MAIDLKKTFEALPHIDCIWVNGDIFYLQEEEGFKPVKRSSVITEDGKAQNQNLEDGKAQKVLNLNPKNNQIKK